jgi:hypothetical protein
MITVFTYVPPGFVSPRAGLYVEKGRRFTGPVLIFCGIALFALLPCLHSCDQ